MSSFHDQSEYAGFTNSSPAPQEVNAFHQNSDKDSSAYAQHHTLGKGSNQSAPGDHNHNEEYSGISHTHERLDQAGSVFLGGPASSVAIVFDEPFDAAPVVNATFTIGANVALFANVDVTSTGFTAYIYGLGGTWTTGAVSLYWHATPYSS